MSKLSALLQQLKVLSTDKKYYRYFTIAVKGLSIGLTLLNLAAVIILCIRETHSAVIFLGAMLFSLISLGAWGLPMLFFGYILEHYPSAAVRLGVNRNRSSHFILPRAALLLIPALIFTIYAFVTLPRFVL